MMVVVCLWFPDQKSRYAIMDICCTQEPFPSPACLDPDGEFLPKLDDRMGDGRFDLSPRYMLGKALQAPDCAAIPVRNSCTRRDCQTSQPEIQSFFKYIQTPCESKHPRQLIPGGNHCKKQSAYIFIYICNTHIIIT